MKAETRAETRDEDLIEGAIQLIGLWVLVAILAGVVLVVMSVVGGYAAPCAGDEPDDASPFAYEPKDFKQETRKPGKDS